MATKKDVRWEAVSQLPPLLESKKFMCTAGGSRLDIVGSSNYSVSFYLVNIEDVQKLKMWVDIVHQTAFITTHNRNKAYNILCYLEGLAFVEN
jgi:hypothetical protein